MREGLPSVRLILVSVDDKMGPEVRAFVDGAGLDAPIVYEEEGTIYEKFGVEQLPQTFILDRSGKILMEGRRYGDGAEVPSWQSPQAAALLRKAERGVSLGLPRALED